jgi:hypothetical protein
MLDKLIELLNKSVLRPSDPVVFLFSIVMTITLAAITEPFKDLLSIK